MCFHRSSFFSSRMLYPRGRWPILQQNLQSLETHRSDKIWAIFISSFAIPLQQMNLSITLKRLRTGLICARKKKLESKCLHLLPLNIFGFSCVQKRGLLYLLQHCARSESMFQLNREAYPTISCRAEMERYLRQCFWEKYQWLLTRPPQRYCAQREKWKWQRH